MSDITPMVVLPYVSMCSRGVGNLMKSAIVCYRPFLIGFRSLVSGKGGCFNRTQILGSLQGVSFWMKTTLDMLIA